MSGEKKIEQLIILGIDAAKKMISTHGNVIPFAVRVFMDSEEVTLSSYYDEFPGDDWLDLIHHTTEKLKPIVKKGDIHAVGIFTTLQNGDQNAVGVQIETAHSARLFIYPYSINDKDEVIMEEEEPIQSDSLIADRVLMGSI